MNDRMQSASTVSTHLAAVIPRGLVVALCGIAALWTVPPAPMAAQEEDDPPWRWSEEAVFEAVNRVRAGRDLNPDSWPDGGRVAVLLSFDVDNETVWLRNGDTNVGGLSQGEYGSRVASAASSTCSTSSISRRPSSAPRSVSASRRTRST